MSRIRNTLARMSDYSSNPSKKKLFITIFGSLLIVSAVIGIVAGLHSSETPRHVLDSHSHAVLKSACTSTLYPDLCYSAIAESKRKVTSQKDVIEASLNLTTTAVEHNYFAVKKLSELDNITEREKTALHDCLETIDETLDELHEAVEDLEEYPDKKSLSQHADDLKTLISSAITNQETCLDGFSHDEADKRIRKALLAGQVHVEKMCSNALAMIKNMTDTDIANEELKRQGSTNRKLKEGGVDEEGWPEWLSAGDRRLLQSSSVTPNAVVAADGSGDFKTVSAAVAAAPDKSKSRYVIRIKAGVYRENVDVSKKKTNIMFMGDGRTSTIITGSRNVKDGSTTFHSATVGKLA